MNPPRFFNRLLGSLPAFTLLLLLACGLVYEWWSHQESASGWLPVIAFVMVGMASNARTEVTRYKTWKRSWDAMEGRPPPPSLHWLKAMGFFIVSCAFGYMVFLQLSKNPPFVDEWAIGIFSLSTLGFLYQLRKRRLEVGPRAKKLKKQKPQAAFTASVCLPVPKPGRQPTMAELPPYCQRLLGRSPSLPR